MYLVNTEFHTKGNRGYSVPVHPKLSFHKLQSHDCHNSKHNINTTSKLQLCFYISTCIMSSVSVLYVSVATNIEADNLSALGNSTFHSVINDEALDDRADKCYISNHHRHSGRRQYAFLQNTTANKPCKYLQCV